MERHPGRGLGGSGMQSFRALSQWSQGASPSQDIDVFLQALVFIVFIWVS